MQNETVSSYENIQKLIHELQNTHFIDYQESKKKCEVLLSLCEDSKYSYGTAFAHARIALCLLYLNDPESFLHHLKRAETIANENDYYDVLIDQYNLAGIYHLNLYDDVSAFTAFSKGVEAAILYKDYIACAIFYNNIGDLLASLNAHEEALDNYEKSLNALKKVRDPKVAFYEKNILLNVFEIMYIKKDTKQMDICLQRLDQVKCDQGILPYHVKSAKIRYQKYLNKHADMKEEVQNLLSSMENEIKEVVLPLYLQLLAFSCEHQYKDAIHKIVHNIHVYKDQLNAQEKINVVSILLDFKQNIDIPYENLYKEFFTLINKTEQLSKSMNCDSLKNMLHLYYIDRENKQAQQRQKDLSEIVNIDELTGLYNRRHYSETFQQYIHDKRIHKLAFVMIDIDFFKEYNDTYGHLSGDNVLQGVANAIARNLPETGIAAHYGGDEFSCLLYNCEDEQVRSFIEKVQEEVRIKNWEHLANKKYKRITLSFGFVNQKITSSTKETQLMKLADKALYSSKNKGRNTYSKYEKE